ncbi:MAG TPA: S8 family serine peptidase [Gemmatimonadales bacterium]|nr:S8 family serine peptidase [Gemmatimonadales bacterium]
MRVSILGLLAAAAAGAFAIGACTTEPTPTADTTPTTSASAPIAASPTSMRSPGAGEQLISAFLHYRADAPANRRGMVRRLGAHRVHDLEDLRILAAVLPPEAAGGLAALPWVETVEIDSSPPARVAGGAAGDLVTWGVDSIGAPAVHAGLGNEGAGIVVGVLDTRVRCDHADLAGRIVGGYDFVDDKSEVCPSFWDAVRYPVHGTAVAGIIAAARNGVGVLGVAPKASLYIARVCDDNGDCASGDVLAALYRMAKIGAQVVNLSLGTHCGRPVGFFTLAVLRNLYDLGVSVVAAAGNGDDGGCQLPVPAGGYPEGEGVVTASHWLPGDTQLPYYSYGPLVDIAAPSRVPTAHPTAGINSTMHDGTSFSAPHVSGTLALLLAAGFSGPNHLARRLFESATDRGASGWDDHWGWGTLDAEKAVARRPVVTSLTGPDAPINRAGTYRLTASVSYGAPPIGIRWSVAYSSQSVAQNYSVIGGLSHSLDVPEGEYAIQVTATPLETIYGRTGSMRSLALPVCTSGDGGGGGNPYVLSGKGGGLRPSRVAGC